MLMSFQYKFTQDEWNPLPPIRRAGICYNLIHLQDLPPQNYPKLPRPFVPSCVAFVPRVALKGLNLGVVDGSKRRTGDKWASGIYHIQSTTL